MNLCINTAFILLVFVHAAWASSLDISKDEQKILNILFSTYDKRIIPVKYGPVYVYVAIYVRSLFELDADKNLFKIQLSFRQQWYDRRFHFESKYGPDFFIRPRLDRMWLPNLFFQDAMGHVHETLTPDTEVRIYPNATVDCTSRISFDVYWPMDLSNFPMDKQVFEMEILTHENRAKDIAIHWLSRYKTPRGAIRISKMLHSIPFAATSMGAYPCPRKANTTAEDSCKKMMIHFKRDFTYYILRAFIPTISLVMLSWIPFWLHPCCMTSRLSMATVVLSIFIILAVVESGPRVPYLKAMDIWMGSCFCFIFCALIEVVAARNSITTEEERNKKLTTENIEEMRVNGETKTNSCLPPKYTFMPPYKHSLNQYFPQAQKIDVISRFLFPMAFSIFNLVFWLFHTMK